MDSSVSASLCKTQLYENYLKNSRGLYYKGFNDSSHYGLYNKCPLGA
jgi:hypothetical protein